MSNPFNEKYFDSGNYIGYLDRAERYSKLAEELVELFTSIKLINKKHKILDYGCATGFLLDGLYDLGFTNTHGYDISEWALSHVDINKHKIVNLDKPQVFNMSYILDVFEHMEDKDIISVLNTFSSSIITVRIPCSVNGTSFYLPQSRRDKTHINCKTKEQWINLMNSCNYEFLFSLNLKQIYDSDGVFCACFRNIKG